MFCFFFFFITFYFLCRVLEKKLSWTKSLKRAMAVLVILIPHWKKKKRLFKKNKTKEKLILYRINKYSVHFSKMSQAKAFFRATVGSLSRSSLIISFIRCAFVCRLLCIQSLGAVHFSLHIKTGGHFRLQYYDNWCKVIDCEGCSCYIIGLWWKLQVQ